MAYETVPFDPTRLLGDTTGLLSGGGSPSPTLDTSPTDSGGGQVVDTAFITEPVTQPTDTGATEQCDTCGSSSGSGSGGSGSGGGGGGGGGGVIDIPGPTDTGGGQVQNKGDDGLATDTASATCTKVSAFLTRSVWNGIPMWVFIVVGYLLLRKK